MHIIKALLQRTMTKTRGLLTVFEIENFLYLYKFMQLRPGFPAEFKNRTQKQKCT